MLPSRWRRRNRSGYVLIMTLVSISIAAISLSGFARHSLQLALQTSRAKVELQERWARLSCQRALLEHADQIFQERSESKEGEPLPWPQPATVLKRLKLGNCTVTLLLSDEDAKVSLNAIFKNPHARNKLPTLLRQLQSQPVSLPVELRPSPENASDVPPFASWGQVFAMNQPAKASIPAYDLMWGTQQITCWGSEKVNVARASDRTIRAVAAFNLEEEAIDKFLELRRTSGKLSFQSAGPANPRAGQRNDLSRLFTDESQCYSLWLEIQSDKNRSYSLSILDAIQQRTHSFVW